MAISVDQQTDAVAKMGEHWPLIDALMGGTAAMRAAKEAYLPREPREDEEDYEYRRKTSTLFPAFERTVGVMAGKPFSKQVTFSKDTPTRIVELAQNIDGEGRNLHSFASDVMMESLSPGFCGVLVDYTRTEGKAKTQADERAMGARPYWVHIRHGQILGWRTGKVDGFVRLTMLRIAETHEVEDGDYGSRAVNRVRVLRIGSWELWEKPETGGAYVKVDEGNTTLKAIPFVPFYGKRLGFMRGAPPLLELAHQNIKHWQQQSDQDDSARFARKRLLVFSGVDNDEAITASSNSAVKLPVGAKADIVQGSAESVTVGRSELDALEAQMIQTGAELLVAKPGDRTATEAANDAEANKSDLQRIVEAFEDSLDQCLQFTAEWLKLPEGGHASLFKDFAAGSLSEATAQLLISLQQAGLITKATAIREQQRRGILAPDIDPVAELEAVKEEGPPLGTLGLNDDNGQ